MELAGALLEGVVDRLARPDYGAFEAQLRSSGYCARPVRLRGQIEVCDGHGGRRRVWSTDGEPDELLRKACGNRREAVCGPCAERYRGDAWQLIAAGLRGGKGVPESVAGHPAAFATLTAPSFGLVHAHLLDGDGRPQRCRPRRDAPVCPHGVALACSVRHAPDEPCLGEPLCADCFDYEGAVTWNNLLGEMWRRTTIYLPRRLAGLLGITQKRVHELVRVSYVKVAEYQARGLVHLHPLIRLDRRMPAYRADEFRPPDRRFTVQLLEDALRGAAAAVSSPVPDALGGGEVRWGAQLDVQQLAEEDAERRKRAGYLTKYSTKSTEQAGGLLHRIPSSEVDSAPVREHVRRYLRAAFELQRPRDGRDRHGRAPGTRERPASGARDSQRSERPGTSSAGGDEHRRARPHAVARRERACRPDRAAHRRWPGARHREGGRDGRAAHNHDRPSGVAQARQARPAARGMCAHVWVRQPLPHQEPVLVDDLHSAAPGTRGPRARNCSPTATGRSASSLNSPQTSGSPPSSSSASGISQPLTPISLLKPPQEPANSVNSRAKRSTRTSTDEARTDARGCRIRHGPRERAAAADGRERPRQSSGGRRSARSSEELGSRAGAQERTPARAPRPLRALRARSPGGVVAGAAPWASASPRSGVMRTSGSTRRSYGTGSLYTKTDSNGRETWYGHWRANGRQVKRRLGPKRREGSTDGLTKTQAETRLRRLIVETKTVRPAAERLSVEDVAHRYLVHAERHGRKPSTLANIESEVRVHLMQFFGGRSLDAIRPEDVLDLVAVMEAKGPAPKTIRNVIATLSALFNFAMAPQRGWASANPCQGLELPAVRATTEIRFLTLEEIDLLVAHARPGPFQAIDRALYVTRR